MANQRRSFRRAGPRRATTWEGFSVSFAGVTAAAPAFAIVVAEAVLENFPNPTLVRQRGSYLAYANAGGATLDSILFLGLYFADASAVAAGIASLETPGTDVGSDWIWIDQIALSDNSGTLDQNRPTVAAGRRMIDGKAMRKADQNQALILVAEVVDFGATLLNATATVSARLLFKK